RMTAAAVASSFSSEMFAEGSDWPGEGDCVCGNATGGNSIHVPMTIAAARGRIKGRISNLLWNWSPPECASRTPRERWFHDDVPPFSTREACGIDMPELIRLPKCWTSLHPMGTASEIRRRGPWSLVQQCRPRCLDGCHVVPTSTARTTDITANDHRVVAGPAALIPL